MLIKLLDKYHSVEYFSTHLDQDDRCDTSDEVRMLKKYGEIEESKEKNKNVNDLEFGDSDNDVNFDIDEI
jgi:hypothetical protein